MTDLLDHAARNLSGFVLVGGWSLAMMDWLMLPRDACGPARPEARRWAAGALALAGILIAIQCLAFGFAGGWRLIAQGGWMLIVQAAGVWVLVETGWHRGRTWGRATLRRLRPAGGGRWPWGWLALALGGMVVWTMVTARLVPHRIETDLPARLGLDQMPAGLRWPLAIALLTLAPILEETFYRHYLLQRIAGWLRRRGHAAAAVGGNAIILTSLLFAVGHLGQIDPVWLKWVQIFGPGLLLGATAWRHGLEPAIALHWAFNLSLIPLGFLLK